MVGFGDWPVLVDGFDELTLSQQRSVRSKLMRDASKLNGFERWLVNSRGVKKNYARQCKRYAWRLISFSLHEPIYYIEHVMALTAPESKLRYVDALRYLCRWILSTDRPGFGTKEWARPLLKDLDRVRKSLKGDQHQYAKASAAKRRGNVVDKRPLSETELYTLLDELQKVEYPQHPWAKNLLLTYVNMGIPTGTLVRIRALDIENLVDRWGAGRPLMIGVLEIPHNRKGLGRKRLYPAQWALPHLKMLLDWPLTWETLADVISPSVRRHRKNKLTNHHDKSRKLLNKLARETVGPFLDKIMNLGRTPTIQEIQQTLLRTTQARVIRELGDWATAAQLQNWSVAYLRTFDWAVEAYQGPDTNSVWNDDHPHDPWRSTVRG